MDLLYQLGFANDAFTENYLRFLQSIHGRYERRYYTVRNKNSDYEYWELYYDTSKVIDELKDEISKKQNRLNLPQKQNIREKISASDLANYTYCPVSFAINNTFEIESNKKAQTGTFFHNKQLLLKEISDYEKYGLESESVEIPYKDLYLKSLNHPIIKIIHSSELIFAGHNKNNTTQFFEYENFIGQPDYIFKDGQGHTFVVEEKFKHIKIPKDYEVIDQYNITWFDKIDEALKYKAVFYKNHESQLQSYIYLLPQIMADFGYLIYWIYDWSNNVPFIYNVHVKKINKSIDDEFQSGH